jgi:hypothetical protein
MASGDIDARCAECLRLWKAYVLAILKVGQLEELLHSAAEHPDMEHIRQELQKAEEIRVAAREAKLSHQATHGR